MFSLNEVPQSKLMFFKIQKIILASICRHDIIYIYIYIHTYILICIYIRIIHIYNIYVYIYISLFCFLLLIISYAPFFKLSISDQKALQC